MSTYLLFAQNPEIEQIQQKIQNKATKTAVLIIESQEGKAIGIEKSRELIKFAQKKPLDGGQKLIVIYDSHKLTEEAQNALLKTLEEHADFVDIVLVSKTEQGLLDTVLSRCKRLYSSKGIRAKLPKVFESVNTATSAKVGHKLGLAQKMAKLDKEQIVFILEEWAKESEMSGEFENAECLLNLARELESMSINARLALENCFLNLS